MLNACSLVKACNFHRRNKRLLSDRWQWRVVQ